MKQDEWNGIFGKVISTFIDALNISFEIINQIPAVTQKNNQDANEKLFLVRVAVRFTVITWYRAMFMDFASLI